MSAKRKLEIEMTILQAQIHRRAILHDVQGLREALTPMRSASGMLAGALSLLNLRRSLHRHEGEKPSRWTLRALVIGYVLAKRLMRKSGSA